MKNLFRSTYFAFIIAVTALLTSCNSDDEFNPEELPLFRSNDPVFFTSFTVNGKEVTVRAGKDSYFMFTDFSIDSHNVYSTHGTFVNHDCPEEEKAKCPGSLEFTFRDDQPANAGSSNFVNSLSPGNKPFKGLPDTTITSYLVKFQSSVNDPAGNYDLSWLLDRMVEVNDHNPRHVYQADNTNLSVYMYTRDNDLGVTSSTVNKVDISDDCNVNFSYQVVSGEISALNTTAEGSGNYTFLWDFGSGFLPLDQQPTMDFTGQDTIRACLKLQTDQGCEATRCKTLVINPNYNLNTGDFEFTTTPDYEVNHQHLNEVVVKYTDAEGNHYSSDRFPQPSESYIEITGRSEYRNDHKSNRTRKLELNFGVRIFGESENDYLDISEGAATVAVPIP